MNVLACLCFAQSQVLLQGTICFYDFDIDSSSSSDLLKCPVFRNLSSGLLLLVLHSAASQQPQLKEPRRGVEKWLSTEPVLTLLLPGALEPDSAELAV